MRTTLVLLLLLSSPSWSQTLRIGDHLVAPGERNSFSIEVVAGEARAQLPVTVINGLGPGPVLALIAGVHGYEYPPILALQRIRSELDPQTLTGTVILVHLANPPSFFGRTVYASPVDGVNLNRAFPGDPEGTLSARIAHLLTTQVIEQADAVVDLHAGDGNEALRPYVYMPRTGDADYDARARALALAFGLDTVVVDSAPVTAPDASVLLDMTAISRGIPAITTETGRLGRVDAGDVELALTGIRGVLRHLGMIAGAPPVNEAVVWLEGFEVVRSPATGVFRPAVEPGWSVAEAGLLGTVHDLFGDPVAEVRAPFAGVVNYVIGTPPISAGEPAAMVSRIAEE